MLFIVAQKVVKYLGYFRSKICSQELSKIAQSGHTGSRVSNQAQSYCASTDACFECFCCCAQFHHSLNFVLTMDQTMRSYSATALVCLAIQPVRWSFAISYICIRYDRYVVIFCTLKLNLFRLRTFLIAPTITTIIHFLFVEA